MNGEARQPRQERAQRVLMIGGAMRSGTTVIQRALCTARNANPYLSESWFLRDLLAMYGFRLSRFDLMGADQFGSRDVYSRIIAENIEQYLRLVSAQHAHPEVLILKHPELSRHFAELAHLSPRMLFLVVVRDPRDVLASMKAVRAKHERDHVPGPLSALRTTEALCNFYASHYAQLLGSEERLGARLKFARYEDVMRDPRGSIAAIGAFCGADYDLGAAADFQEAHARSATFDKARRMADAFSGAFWSDLYTKPMSDERIGRYSDALTPVEVQEIEARLAPIGERFGYWTRRLH